MININQEKDRKVNELLKLNKQDRKAFGKIQESKYFDPEIEKRKKKFDKMKINSFKFTEKLLDNNIINNNTNSNSNKIEDENNSGNLVNLSKINLTVIIFYILKGTRYKRLTQS